MYGRVHTMRNNLKAIAVAPKGHIHLHLGVYPTCILTWSTPGFCVSQQSSLPKNEKVAALSSKMGVANSVVMTCPETLTCQVKRMLV